MKTKFLVIALVVVCAGHIKAQLTLSGEYRPRVEMAHGVKSLASKGQDASLFTTQRSRLNLNYKTEGIVTKMVIQDVRVWGNQSQLVSADGLLSLHEAWGQVELVPKVYLKAGRQELIYDDHRIFGSVGWAQQARSHDLGIIKYEGKFKVHAGFAYNQDGSSLTSNLYTTPKSYKAMQYLWFHHTNDTLSVSFLALNNGLQYTEVDTAGVVTKQNIKYSQTIGPRVTFKKNKISAALAAYYQMGENTAQQNISAYYVAADVGYKVSSKLGVNVGYELLSGTSQTDTANKDVNSFAPLYGTNHKFNGFMDYFYVGNHGGSVGLQDIYLKAKYKMDKTFIMLHAHMFSSAADILDVDKLATDGTYSALSSGLGTELDLVFGYTINKSANIKIGYSQLFATSSMEAIKGGDKDEMQNWAWVMLTVKPVFFKGEK